MDGWGDMAAGRGKHTYYHTHTWKGEPARTELQNVTYLAQPEYTASAPNVKIEEEKNEKGLLQQIYRKIL